MDHNTMRYSKTTTLKAYDTLKSIAAEAIFIRTFAHTQPLHFVLFYFDIVFSNNYGYEHNISSVGMSKPNILLLLDIPQNLFEKSY